MKHIKAIYQAWLKDRQTPSLAKRSRDEHEFQPGNLEVIERPPAPWARRTALLLTLLLVITLTWSFIGHLDIHARSTGRLIVSSNSKVIQSLEPGVIASINVRDGQSVKTGDVLIGLNPIDVNAEVQELEDQQLFRELELARLKALLTDNPLKAFKAPDRVSSRRVGVTEAHLLSEWQEIQANLKSLDGEIDVNRANSKAGHVEIASLRKLTTNINERFEALLVLSDRNLYPKIDLLEQEKERLETERTLSQQQSQMEILEAELQSLKEQRDSYLAKIRREYYDRLSQTQVEIAVVGQQLIKANEKRRLMTLRAPVDGVVQELAVHTLGGVVQPAQQLMVIVPEDTLLEAEVLVLNKDVGFVNDKQKVAIKIDSFPYTRYGTITGEVIYVSKDSVQDEQLGMVFPARVKITQNSILVGDKNVPLQAGMSIVAEIRTGNRRVIDYLLSPLQQYQSEAMRER